MKRYLIMKQDKIEWLWDSKKAQLYERTEDGSQKRDGNIHTIEKFLPFLEIIKETDKLPDGWIYDEEENRERELGLKE